MKINLFLNKILFFQVIILAGFFIFLFPFSALAAEQIDQENTYCDLPYGMNYTMTFAQSFTPSTTNISSLDLKFTMQPYSNYRLDGLRLCTGEMATPRWEDAGGDWDCANPGQKLLAETNVLREDIPPPSPLPVQWVNFKFAEPIQTNIGEKYFFVFRGYHLDFCGVKYNDFYKQGEARSDYNALDFTFRTYHDPDWVPRRNPVIIVPGIMGSWYKHGSWQIDPIFHTYDYLIEALSQSGYGLNKDLFIFPYNWRQNNVLSAIELKNKINEVKQIADSKKVDLVAHSMGGLVARSYVQGTDYENDVRKLIFLDTPHLGAPESYLAYEGGYMRSNLFRYMVNILRLEAIENGYINMLGYIHEQIPSTGQLLPIFNYLQSENNQNWYDRIYPLQYPRNEFLENLNINPGIDALKQRTEVINIFSHAPEVNATLSKIRVVDDPNIYDNKWMDGYPENLDNGNKESLILGDGDGTVPINSLNGLARVKTIEIADAAHREITTKAQKEVIAELIGKTPDNFVSGPWAVIKRILMFRVYSPVDFVIISPDGKKLGKDFSLNSEINEINGAFYSGFDTDSEFAIILNPKEGEYKVEVEGTDNGSYKLSASYIDAANEIDKEYTGQISANNIQEFNLNYSESTATPLSDPLPIDVIPPVITINTPLASSTFLRSQSVNINYLATDDFSGIATVTAKLDGVVLTTSTVDLFYYHNGEHVLEINASDKSGNAASSSVKFYIISTLDSAINNIERMWKLNWITGDVTAKNLIKNLENIKWRLQLFNKERTVINKIMEKIETASLLKQKNKDKIIQELNQQIIRINEQEDKYLNSAWQLIEKNINKYLEKGLISQQAYDLLIDNNNYLKNNL